MSLKSKIIIALTIAVTTVTITSAEFNTVNAQTTSSKTTQQQALSTRDAALKKAETDYKNEVNELNIMKQQGRITETAYKSTLENLKKTYEAEKKQIVEKYQQELKGIKVTPPDVYSFKSDLLPGPKEAGFRTYFIDTLLPRVIKLAISITAVLSLLFLIYGGYRFIFNLGNTEDVEKATGIIKYAIIGLVIAIFSYFIIAIVNAINF